MIKVSVIVPCYNAELFIKKCLDSLVYQTLDEIEIICVNNASVDNTADIIREYELAWPEKVRYIDLKTNLCAGGARNAGMDIARGEYIGFVDSDDWVDEHMYECLYTIAHDKDADIVECDFHDTADRNYAADIPDTYEITGGMLDDAARSKLIVAASLTVWSRIYKQSFIDLHKLKFLSGLAFEDIVWSPIAFCYVQSLYHVKKKLYYYYHHPLSVTESNVSLHRYDKIVISHKLIEEAKYRGIYERFKYPIEITYILTGYVFSLTSFVWLLDSVDLDRLYAARLYMYNNLPEYFNNPYIRPRQGSNYHQAIMLLMDTDPRLAFLYTKLLHEYLTA